MDDLRVTVEKMLEMYMVEEGTTPQGAMRDMLTEMMHIAEEKGLDFESAVFGAEEFYWEELKEVEPG